jgi:hypothetical protein
MLRFELACMESARSDARHTCAAHDPCSLLPALGVLMQATIQNLAVDAAGVGVFGFLLRREFKTKEKAEGVIEQEESLGRLQVSFAESDMK